MDQAIFHLKRDIYRADTTLGELIDPCGDHFCYVLEDTVRAHGIKDMGRTAIPMTQDDFTYFLRIRTSPRYGKVVVVYTDKVGEDLYMLIHGGISFTQILCHGGNDEEDTKGCLLVNKNRSEEDMKAWGSMKTEMVEEVERLLSEGYDVRLRVTNLAQRS